MTLARPYCGDLALELALRRHPDPAGGVPALFAGRRISYSFNTRVAIRKACDILGLKPGDEVLAPAYNCGSELDPLHHAGLTIRLYPVTVRTEIDPGSVERMIGPRTRAIYLTHYFGFLQPAAGALRELCDRHGLWLIEDCALSLLSGAPPADGRAGHVAVFCFYKFFPVLGGGALVLNSPTLDGPSGFDRPAPTKVMVKRLMRAGLGAVLGMDRAAVLTRRLRGQAGGTPVDVPSETRPDMPGHYYFDPGLCDARIAGLTARALRGFDIGTTIAARRANYLRLRDRIAGIAGIAPLFADLPPDTVPLSMPIQIAGSGRDALARALQAEGITATSWWSGYNRHLDFSTVPDACHLKDHVLALPMHQYFDDRAIDHVADRLQLLSKQIG